MYVVSNRTAQRGGEIPSEMDHVFSPLSGVSSKWYPASTEGDVVPAGASSPKN